MGFKDKVAIVCDRCGKESLVDTTGQDTHYSWGTISVTYGNDSDWTPIAATYAVCKKCKVEHWSWFENKNAKMI